MKPIFLGVEDEFLTIKYEDLTIILMFHSS